MVGLFTKKNKDVVDNKKEITVLYDNFEKQINILRNRIKDKDKVIQGVVIKNKQLSHTIQYPTANIEFNNDILNIKNSFYLSQITINNEQYHGISFVYKNSISTYILNFDKNIYGEKIKISIKKILSTSNLNDNNVNDLEFLKQEFDKCVELSRQYIENKQ